MKRFVVVAGLLLACRSASGPEAGAVRRGVWGTEDAGAIVTDSGVHIHIGCTAGNISQVLAADSTGRFDATGFYNLTLYPVARGPDRPARFEGSVVGGFMELTVTLTDTAVVMGPVRLRFGEEPGMVNCPICRTHGGMKRSSSRP